MTALDTVLLAATVYVGALSIWTVTAKMYAKFGGGSGKLISKRMCDGSEIFGIDGDRSTEATYRKIFINEHYFANGKVSLKGIESPLVVDVGAHIGMFSKYIAQHYPNAEVMSFEPIPALSTAIRRNTASHSDRVCVEQVACGAKTDPRTPFNYSRTNTASTSQIASPELVPKGASWLMFVRCSLLDGVDARRCPKYPTVWLAALLGTPIVGQIAFLFVSPVILFAMAWKFASQKSEKVLCRMQRLSDVLGEYDELAGRKIDLLKISACGCGWNVMRGVDDGMWERVQQAVVEVHNTDSKNLEVIVQFLRSVELDEIFVSHGGATEVEKLMGVYTVFATRGGWS